MYYTQCINEIDILEYTFVSYINIHKNFFRHKIKPLIQMSTNSHRLASAYSSKRTQIHFSLIMSEYCLHIQCVTKNMTKHANNNGISNMTQIKRMNYDYR